MPAARRVTFYSARLLDKARELGLDRPNLSVVYPAVRHVFMDVDRATRADWRTDLGIAESRVILNVKRLHELAGQKYLLDAFARVVRSYGDVRLVICGTGPLRQPLEDQARDLGLTDKITFAGLVPNEKVARYAGVADVFALPSLLEALPTVAVESLAAGTPVVSADHPGGVELHDIFGDDVLVVPKENVDDLARALTSAIVIHSEPVLRTAESIRNHFSPAAVEAETSTDADKVLHPLHKEAIRVARSSRDDHVRTAGPSRCPARSASARHRRPLAQHRGTLGASLQSLVGGNITLYSSRGENAPGRVSVDDGGTRRAGANAIIGMRYDANEVAAGITEVLAYGTAVVVEPQ